MKILIVEDQIRLAQLVKQGLTERAYTVTMAHTCAAARDALCADNFDLIILDLGLRRRRRRRIGTVARLAQGGI